MNEIPDPPANNPSSDAPPNVPFDSSDIPPSDASSDALFIAPSGPREERLALAVSLLLDRMSGGEVVELDGACTEFPEFHEELREFWGTLMVTRSAGSLRHSASDERPLRRNRSTFSGEPPAACGPWVLEEELGRGGMGVVYRARHRESGETVALKMMLQGELSPVTNLKRFRAEAQAVQGLRHPNIVRIIDVGEDEGIAWFCMDLIDGETLARRLEHGPLPPREAARILMEVSRAIDFAHGHGLLHRDIKPSNILLARKDNKPCVVDFGLARDMAAGETLTRSGAVLGTPAYMAPEQAAGQRGQVSPASDVYSLGAVLYHMLTGRPPFQGASPVDTVLMLLEQDPITPRVLNREVDRQLEMIAMRCLQKPQDLRYRSAGHLANDLESYLHDRPVSAQRGRLGHLIANLMKETHHASVMENWGLLWMWHSLALLTACVCTQAMHLAGIENRWLYWLLWMAGFGTWAGVFWWLRRRMGPVTFVERQIAHLWLGSIICIGAMFPLESYLGLPVLQLAPLLGLVAGMVFLVKASILSGIFYIPAAIEFATALVMAIFPRWAQLIFGVVTAGCFFLTGLMYYRRTRR